MDESKAVRAKRADAVRSRARLLEAAVELIARDGAGVSLEAIAREAGVGSATLHRHFTTRWDLLEAIFKDRAEQIAQRADDLALTRPDDAFAEWFVELIAMASSTSGLAAVIEPVQGNQVSNAASCHALIAEAGDGLLRDGKSAGRIRQDLEIDELMALAMAISSLPTADARNRLQEVAINGWVQAPRHT